MRELPGIPPPARIEVPGIAWVGALFYDDTPPSLNAVGSRGNAKGAHWDFTNAKQMWQGICEQLLMQARAPRGMAQAFAGARMRFPRPNTQRDSGNFSTILEKGLGDALVNARVIPNDTASEFYFTGVDFEREGGPNRTTIVLWLIEKEDGS